MEFSIRFWGFPTFVNNTTKRTQLKKIRQEN